MEWLSYLLVGIPVLLAFLLACGLVVLTWGMSRSFLWGVFIVVVLALVEAAVVALPPIRIGIHIYVGDIVAVLLGCAALLRADRYPLESAMGWIWLIFGAAMGVSFILGALQYGVAAGSDFRTYFFYFWVTVAYLMTFDLSANDLNRAASILIAGSLLMACLAMTLWVALAAGIELRDTSTRFADPNALRVIAAGGAGMISMGGLLLMHRWLLRKSGAGVVVLACFLFVAVLALQHRTVWVSTVLCLAALAVFHRGQHARSGKTLIWVVLLVGFGVAVVTLVTGGGGVAREVGASAQEVFTERSTFMGRVEGWRALISDWWADGWRSRVMGQSFGSGYVREQQGAVVSWSPHNYFVHVLLRTGLIGLFAMSVALALSATRLLKLEAAVPAGWAAMLLSLLVYEIAFFVTYSPGMQIGLYSGLVVSVVARLRVAVPISAEPLPSPLRPGRVTSAGTPAPARSHPVGL